jgi:hypothetical protein
MGGAHGRPGGMKRGKGRVVQNLERRVGTVGGVRDEEDDHTDKAQGTELVEHGGDGGFEGLRSRMHDLVF